jgi:hypothetical protein
MGYPSNHKREKADAKRVEKNRRRDIHPCECSERGSRFWHTTCKQKEESKKCCVASEAEDAKFSP